MSHITVAICDHCGRKDPWDTGWERYRVGDGPALDICSSCQLRPFAVVNEHPNFTAIRTVLAAMGVSL